jgi:MGT family glycosyltransferase
MARLAFLLDDETGHLYSTFKLARELQQHGHQVWYFGYSTSEGLIHKNGFKFRAVYDRVTSSHETANAFPWLPSGTAALKSLTKACHAINPELFITLSMFCAEALVLRLGYNKPVILIRNHFSPWPRKRSCREIVALKLMTPSVASRQLLHALRKFGLVNIDSDKVAQLVIDHMPEVVLLPRELRAEHLDDEHMTYAGFMIDAERPSDAPFPWASIPSGMQLIYCSLGSNPHLEIEVTHRFFRVLIEAMVSCPDKYLILSTGRLLKSTALPAPNNVYVTEWAPQLEILDRAALMLSHGGIGSVKECLTKAVPMVVFPLMRDQFSCAERLVHLGLALRGDVRTVSVESMKALIEAGSATDALRSAIWTMRARCEVDDSAGLMHLVNNAITAIQDRQTQMCCVPST